MQNLKQWYPISSSKNLLENPKNLTENENFQSFITIFGPLKLVWAIRNNCQVFTSRCVIVWTNLQMVGTEPSNYRVMV